MDIFPPEAWQRLGKALERRRGQLGYGFRRRTEFAEGSGLSAKTLARLEHAERDSYPDDTLALAEVIYKWEPGSIAAVLEGGEAVPFPSAVSPAEPQHDVLGKLLASHGVRSLDEVPGLRQVWQISDEDLSEHARLGMIEVALKMRDHRIAEDERSGERRRNSA